MSSATNLSVDGGCYYCQSIFVGADQTKLSDIRFTASNVDTSAISVYSVDINIDGQDAEVLFGTYFGNSVQAS